jgi:hypothetical protein
VEKSTTKPVDAENESAPGVAGTEKVVETGSEKTKTDGQATHSTGKSPDDGRPAKVVNREVREGVPSVPVPAVHTTLLETPGGYQIVPEGVKPEQVGVNAIHYVPADE